eukprot:1194851-Prorocentrum_minimum.AAC.3
MGQGLRTDGVPVLNELRAAGFNPQYSPVQCSPVQCSPVQCRPVQCRPVQCRPVQCSPVQCSPVQCSPVQSIVMSRIRAQCSTRRASSAPTSQFVFKALPWVVGMVLSKETFSPPLWVTSVAATVDALLPHAHQRRRGFGHPTWPRSAFECVLFHNTKVCRSADDTLLPLLPVALVARFVYTRFGFACGARRSHWQPSPTVLSGTTT